LFEYPSTHRIWASVVDAPAPGGGLVVVDDAGGDASPGGENGDGGPVTARWLTPAANWDTDEKSDDAAFWGGIGIVGVTGDAGWLGFGVLSSSPVKSSRSREVYRSDSTGCRWNGSESALAAIFAVVVIEGSVDDVARLLLNVRMMMMDGTTSPLMTPDPGVFDKFGSAVAKITRQKGD